MKLTINCYDAGSISSAISAIEQYKKKIDTFSERVITRVVERAKGYAIENLNLASSMSKEMAAEVAYTIPTITSEFVKPNVAIIRAGGDAIWLEFGSGVYFNGAVGSMPHPKATEVEGIVPIGTYGKGNGAKDIWVYFNGYTFRTSHGTQCTQFMYRALLSVIDDIPKIIGEELK